ncbi:MAG: hypothetical protein SNJ70_06935 [Armatimonadota bacterium]
MNLQPKCLATAIGSLPHKNPEDAVKTILTNIPDAPIWPQLPSLGMNEQMEIQYSENLPRIVIDREKGRMYFDTTGEYYLDLGTFYEKFAEDDVDYFKITPEFSKGIYAMEEALKAENKKRPYVKVQTTGPISFGLTIVDENKRAIYYNEEFKDAVVKGLAMKCRWQIRKFKDFADDVICFIDEPILSAFGSSTYVSVSRDDVVSRLNEVIEAVHQEGGIAGIHCCGNTEWSILIDAGVDIVNLDAFDFGDTIALYPDAVKKHINNGKAIAWGVVPTNSEKIRATSVDELIKKFDEGVENLAKVTGIDKDVLINQAFITPSCGTGSLPVEDAELVFKYLGELSSALRAR